MYGIIYALSIFCVKSQDIICTWSHIELAARSVEENKVYTENEWACNMNSPLCYLCRDLCLENNKYLSQILVRELSFLKK